MNSDNLIVSFPDRIHTNSVRNLCVDKNTETGINTYKKFDDWFLQ